MNCRMFSDATLHDSTDSTCLALKQQMHMVDNKAVGIDEEW